MNTNKMMDKATDKTYLTTQAYATQKALSVRIETHKKYTEPKLDFGAWVLDHISWQGTELVLDIGCGAGVYLKPVSKRLTAGGQLLAGDLSAGMLRDVAAKAIPKAVSLLNANALQIPLATNSCDVVLANHMLYHLPDIEAGVTEVKRVLRPGGYFIATTNAQKSMQTFIKEMADACQALGHPIGFGPSLARIRFTLENGLQFLHPFFLSVELDAFKSELVFSTVEPPLAYINSLRHIYLPQLPPSLSWQAILKQVKSQIEATLKANGKYRVNKTTGVFVATYDH